MARGLNIRERNPMWMDYNLKIKISFDTNNVHSYNVTFIMMACYAVFGFFKCKWRGSEFVGILRCIIKSRNYTRHV